MWLCLFICNGFGFNKLVLNMEVAEELQRRAFTVLHLLIDRDNLIYKIIIRGKHENCAKNMAIFFRKIGYNITKYDLRNDQYTKIYFKGGQPKDTFLIVTQTTEMRSTILRPEKLFYVETVKYQEVKIDYKWDIFSKNIFSRE